MTSRLRSAVCATGCAFAMLAVVTHDVAAQSSGGGAIGAPATGAPQAGGFSSGGAAASGGLSSGSSAGSRQGNTQWDAGDGRAVSATGAVVPGTAAAATTTATAPPPAQPVAVQATAPPAPSPFMTAPATPPPPAAAMPCQYPSVVSPGEITYVKCGRTWYAMAYGTNGPVYMQSAPPPGW